MSKRITVKCGDDVYITNKNTLSVANYFRNINDTNPIVVDRNPYLFKRVLHYLRNPTIDVNENDLPELNYYLTGQLSEAHDYLEINVGGKEFCILKSILRDIPYFDGFLRTEWKDSEKLFIDQDPEIFEHILEYIQDDNYLFPTKYRHIPDYFGIEKKVKIITDDLDFSNETREELIKILRESENTGETDSVSNGGIISLIAHSPPYTESQLPSKYMDFQLTTHYTEFSYSVGLSSAPHPDNNIYRFHLGRQCEIITKLYITIPFTGTSVFALDCIDYPYSIIDEICLSFGGVILYKRSGSSLYHYDCLHKSKEMKIYYDEMYKSKKKCCIVLDFSVLHDSLYLASGLGIWDFFWLEIRSRVTLSSPPEVSIDGLLLINDERLRFAGESQIRKWFNAWSTYEIPFSDTNHVIYNLHHNKLIYRIIFCAISSTPEQQNTVSISKFKIIFANTPYYSEDEHKIQLRMLERSVPIDKRIYEWFVDPNAGFDASRIDDIKLEFYFPETIANGKVYCHIQTLDLLMYSGGAVGLPYI